LTTRPLWQRLIVAGLRLQMDAHNRSFSLLINAALRRARHGVKRDQINVDDYDKVR
jgi:hypothetical protein